MDSKTKKLQIGFWLLVASIFINLQGQKIQCKARKLWDLHKKPSTALIKKADVFIKALGSKKARRRDIAFKKINEIAPYILPYVKKVYPKVKELTQILYLKNYYISNLSNIILIVIFCNYNKQFIWYTILDDKLLIVGNETGVIKGIRTIRIDNFARLLYGIIDNIEDKQCGLVQNDRIILSHEKLVSSYSKEIYSRFSKFKDITIKGKQINIFDKVSNYLEIDGKILFLGWRHGRLYRVICR